MTEIPGFQLQREIGRGSMGVVHLARHIALDRQVAVKSIRGVWGDDREAEQRLRREARALGRLNHPNVVHVYDLIAFAGDLHVVMEYVAGTTLSRALAEGRLPLPQALGLVSELAAALDHAHGNGVVHRDVKPGNVLVTPGGAAKLGDFGVARVLADEEGFRTRVGTILGSPAYMSPEQARGEAAIDARADVYSLAAIAYELLVGRVPFAGDPEAPLPVLEAHISTPPPRPSQLDPAFPEAVEQVLLKGLAKEPRDRPPSAGAFARQLESRADHSWPGWRDGTLSLRPPEAKRERTLSDPEASRVEAAAMAAAEPNPAATQIESPTVPAPPVVSRPVSLPVYRPASRRRLHRVALLGLPAALAAIVALTAAAAVAVWNRSQPPPPLAVTGVSVTVQPVDGVGHCPRADFVFTARVVTNGEAGEIRYQWIKPDGEPSPIAVTRMPAHTTAAVEVFDFSYSGNGTAAGSATLHLLAPADVYSAPVAVSYRCP